MNTLRRIPRPMVKALAAGAVLLAAALPMAFASAASAATAPTLTGLSNGTAIDTAGTTITSTAGNPLVTIADATGVAYAVGDLVVVGTTVIGTVGVASAASTSESVTLVSGATTSEATATVNVYAPFSFGEGTAATPTVDVYGLGFAHDGGNASIVSSDKDLSFTAVTETGTTFLTATVATTGSTTNGPASITLTDDNGTSNALAAAITVNPDPTISSITPSTLADSQVSGLVTVDGSFAAGTGDGTAVLTNTANGTTLEVASATADLAGGFVAANNGQILSASSTALTFYVAALNSFNGSPAAPGTYSLTVTNSDGGPVTAVGDFTVTAAGITNVSPSAVPLTTTSAPITINGNGFEAGATVVATLTVGATLTTTTASTATVTSPNTISLSVTTGSVVGLVSFTVTNPSIGGGNGAVFTGTDVLGVGEAGDANATVTAAAATPSTAIVPGTTGSTPVSLVLTGTGFSPYSTVVALAGTGSTAAAGVTVTPCISSLNGDTLTCSVSVGTGATAGNDGIEVNSGTGTSGAFEGAISISGPTITSSSPTAIALGAPEGTVITLTGTGFNTTATATAVGAGLLASDAGTKYVFADVSPTSATLTLAAPLAATGSKSIVVTITETISAGITESTAPFTITVDNAPAVTSLVNANTKTDGVGAGAVNAAVTITGSGFETGATITKFVNAYGVADTGASGTVASINTNGTQITADITLPAKDVNISDGYTITNTDGGTVTVTAFTGSALTIDAGPSVTAVSPTTATADSTTAFTITGTGFVSGASVSASAANGTCGAASVASSTSVTATCTFLAAGTTGTSLVVTNPDGGSATTAVVLAPATAPVKAAPHATGVHGSAVVGKTVTLTISGTGFFGQPKISSTGTGVKAVVSHDSGKLLTVKVTVSAKGKAGTHAFTIRFSNGKTTRVNYSTKA